MKTPSWFFIWTAVFSAAYFAGLWFGNVISKYLFY